MVQGALSGVLAAVLCICAQTCGADGFYGWTLRGATNRADCARSQIRAESDGLYIRLDRADMADSSAGWIELVPGRDDCRVVPTGGTVRIAFRTPARGIVRSAESLRVLDAQGELFRFRPTRVRRDADRTVAAYDIRQFGWVGGHFAGKPHMGGTDGRNRNDRFDSPLVLRSVAFALDPDIRSGEAVLESVDILAPGESSESCVLDVDTGGRLCLVRHGGANPMLTMRNAAAVRRHWSGVLRLRDFFGEGFDLPVSCTLEPGETMRIPVAHPLKKGIWRVFGDLLGDDGVKSEPEARFAVLDEHPRTPRLPRGKVFRPGIHWHASRFSAKDRALCEDALVACGCKLVRAGGFAFGDIERRKGQFDWSRSDAIMAETEACGISIDAIVYRPPPWSQDTNRIARARHFKRYAVPPEEGTFGDFAERLSARYGTKIDYYEIGNEWDLVPESIMTRDEAVRVHREGYEAFKRGCPEATVMPNGWTHPDVRPDHYGKDADFRVGGDYQEYVMSRIRDCADVYPIHMHGRFEGYRKGVASFLDLRRRIGCGGIPWFSNETACSSVNGQEDDVARFVFQKIMYAWANGSVDYIWYNLVATGREESDPEQGYGLLTADMRPRASYAAFSAFTAVYLGLSFDSVLVDSPPVFAARFEDRRSGARKIVIGGWNSAAAVPCRVRVATDAKSAAAVDLMGNIRHLPIVDGETVWSLSPDPGSLVLEDATFAVPCATDLAENGAAAKAPLRVSAKSVEGRDPDFRMNTADRVVDYHQGIPETRHRVWKGPADLFADVWLARNAGRVRLRVDVADDVFADGDAVEATLRTSGNESIAVAVPVVSERGSVRRFETSLGCEALRLPDRGMGKELSLEIKVLEDDGEGPDGYMHLSESVVFPMPFDGTPIVFRGDAKTAYRDPAAVWVDGVCHLFFTLVETGEDGFVHSYVATSTSPDLRKWSAVRKLTPMSDRDFSSPGNVVRDGDEWVLCFQSYPRPGNRDDGKVRYADATARLFTMRTRDFESWSAPELMTVKGPSVADADMGRMIDPYLLKVSADEWLCFYKQNGASFSRSKDLRSWEFVGKTDAGENACVVSDGGRFVMMHSPRNGMRLKESADLVRWKDVPGEITLGQKDWPWAKGRLTAGFLLDCRDVPDVGKWVLFFHGSGPRTEEEGDFDRNASIGMVAADRIEDFLD